MQSFCAVCNCSIRAVREKNKSLLFIYLFIYFSFLININPMEKNNYKLTVTLYKLN